MPNAFSRTTRAVELHHARRSAYVLVPGLLILGAWLAWFAFGRVPLYETSDRARVEMTGSVAPIASPVAGRVVSANLGLGRHVRAGEVLIELEAGVEEASFREAEVRLRGLERRLAAVREQLRREEEAALGRRAALDAAVAEAEEEARAAAGRARAAQQQATRLVQLHAAAAAADADLELAETEAQVRLSEARASALLAQRLRREREAEAADRAAELARVRREEVGLEGEIEAALAEVERFRALRELRLIRAPLSGQIGEAPDLPRGTVITEGARLGAVVAPADLRVTALLPIKGLGRVRPGQAARVSLAGYPWTEFGHLRATVTEVAQESRDGHFRILLELDSVPAGIALRHGLPAEVEIEAERVSPLGLILRAAGSGRRSSGAEAVDPW